MSLFLGTIKLALACVALWAATAYFGAGAVALVLAVFACVAVGLGHEASSGHSAALQALRDRLRVQEENLNASYDRLQDSIERLEERIRRVDQRIDALTPSVDSADY